MIDRDREPPPGEREQRLEAQLRDARDAHHNLLAEFQNRSRNTLSVIRSLLRRTAATSHSIDDFTQHFEGRLAAYGRGQAAVMRNPAAGADLASLLSDELLAHAFHEGDGVTISGPEVRLQPRAAELFALTFNELVLNSVKFGALRRDTGRIDVTWVLTGTDGDGQLAFRWQETNDAAERTGPGPSGFGTELIEKTLPYELGADSQLAHEPTGTTCTIRAPSAAIVVSRPQGVGGDASEGSAAFR